MSSPETKISIRTVPEFYGDSSSNPKTEHIFFSNIHRILQNESPEGAESNAHFVYYRLEHQDKIETGNFKIVSPKSIINRSIEDSEINTIEGNNVLVYIHHARLITNPEDSTDTSFKPTDYYLVESNDGPNLVRVSELVSDNSDIVMGAVGRSAIESQIHVEQVGENEMQYLNQLLASEIDHS